MTTAADEATGVLAEGPARPLVWSIRRELWENRSVYIAPVAVAAVVLFGFLISTIGMAHRRRATLLLDEAHQRAVIMKPFDGAAMILFFVGFVIAFVIGTAAGMIARSVAITLPTVAPMPQWTSGIAATWRNTIGRRATFSSCLRAAASTPTPRTHARIGTPSVSMSS